MAANRKGDRKPRREIQEVANQITLVGNAIFASRDKINQIEDGSPHA